MSFVVYIKTVVVSVVVVSVGVVSVVVVSIVAACGFLEFEGYLVNCTPF